MTTSRPINSKLCPDDNPSAASVWFRQFAAIALAVLLMATGAAYARPSGPSRVSQVRSSAPLGIPYLTHRAYHSKLEIVRKLGDFQGYTSYDVKYDSDGLSLRAVMNVPAASAPKRGYPVLIMMHGNFQENWGRLSFYNSEQQDADEYRNTDFYAQVITRYAKEGFVVFFPDYRGYGQSETHGQHAGNWQLDRNGNQAVNKQGQTVPRSLDDEGLRANGWLYTSYYTIDVLNLLAAVRSDAATEPARLDQGNVFMWGHSLGGDVAARAFTCANGVKAVSLWSPATTSLWDQAHHYHYDSIYANGTSLEDLFVELQTFNRVHHTALRARDMAPNNFVEQVRGPVQVQVSSDDSDVRAAWAIEYVYELQEYGVRATLLTYPGTDHSFKGEVLEKAIQADLAFFRAQMQE